MLSPYDPIILFDVNGRLQGYKNPMRGGRDELIAGDQVSTVSSAANVLLNDSTVPQQVSLASFALLLAPLILNLQQLASRALDPATQAEYTTAIANAPLGSKRAAAANAIVAAMSPVHRLVISRNGAPSITAIYDGNCGVTNDGIDVTVTLGALLGTPTIVAADINSGVWQFQVQGGSGLTRTITGTAGAIDSGAQLTLSSSPDPSKIFTPNFSFVLPHSIDNLI